MATSPAAARPGPAYEWAREAYAELGVDTEAALAAAAAQPVALHCWQADDVRGLEHRTGAVDPGGLLATGNHPGRARDGDEIRADLDLVVRLLPGVHRINLHACYAETGAAGADRDALEPAHFARWMDWAADRRLALDFNPTYFAHPRAAGGYSLAHTDPAIRDFWVAHGRACRRIAEAMARRQNGPCVLNHWVPDGDKDRPADRWGPRRRLLEAYDAILAGGEIDRRLCVDAVEGKLFGLGSEEYVVGAHEFYLLYALSRGLVPCLDLGHFHPTESVADKVSSLLTFFPRLLLHTSRPVRWDSDHVVVLDDATEAVFLELARGGALERTFVALDYFDASLNRIAAYVVGARATRQALLLARLDPTARLQEAERAGRRAERLAVMEAVRSLPWGAVWDEMCRRAEVPVGLAWWREVEAYEAQVLGRRA